MSAPALGAYVTVGEAARLLGLRGRGWTRTMCRTGRLPALKIGGRWWIDRAAVLDRAGGQRRLDGKADALGALH